jgi:hypothetical protein
MTDRDLPVNLVRRLAGITEESPMTDRDRLAADLHDEWDYRAGEPSEPGVPCEECTESADRLIALGWTRDIHENRLCDSCRKLYGVEPPPLDEERLARALAAHMADFEAEPESFDTPSLVAANVAKAYREDEPERKCGTCGKPGHYAGDNAHDCGAYREDEG